MKRAIIMALVLILLTSAAYGYGFSWQPFKNIISSDDGLYCYYEEKDSIYLVLVNPENGSITGYWKVDETGPYSSNRFANRNLIAVFDGDLILGNNYVSVYRDHMNRGLTRISLNEDGISVVWHNNSLEVFDEEFFVSGQLAITTERYEQGLFIDNVVEINLNSGDTTSRKVPNVKNLRISPNVLITSNINGSEIQYRLLSGEVLWSLDTSRIDFRRVYPIDGYLLLSESDERQLYCLDSEGNKQWKTEYSDRFPRYGFFGKRIGDLVVISGPSSIAFIEISSGQVVLNLENGLEKAPYYIDQNIMVRGISRDSHVKEYEIFDLKTLRVKGSISLDSLGIREQVTHSVPILDTTTGRVFILLKENRLIGIDPESGDIVLDTTLNLPDGDGW